AGIRRCERRRPRAPGREEIGAGQERGGARSRSEIDEGPLEVARAGAAGQLTAELISADQRRECGCVLVLERRDDERDSEALAGGAADVEDSGRNKTVVEQQRAHVETAGRLREPERAQRVLAAREGQRHRSVARERQQLRALAL